MPTWSTPKNWQTGRSPHCQRHEHLHQRRPERLKAPPTDHYECNEATDYTTTSTSFVDWDATNLVLAITTTGAMSSSALPGRWKTTRHPNGLLRRGPGWRPHRRATTASVSCAPTP